MSEDTILQILFKDCLDYEGNQITKNNIKNNLEFRNALINGILENKISGIDEETWKKLNELNIIGNGNIEDAFRQGFNIGACTVASKYLSFIFNNCKIAGGTNKFLKDTKNSKEGEHTWVIGPDNKIYDTTFMLIIDQNYSSQIGYDQENIYNPNIDPTYAASKSYATDKNLNVRR